MVLLCSIDITEHLAKKKNNPKAALKLDENEKKKVKF